MGIFSGGSGGGSGSGAGREIGYDQITAPVTVTATVEATGTLVVQGSAYTFDGAPVMAEFYSPNVQPGAAANEFIALMLFEGATEIAQWGAAATPSANLWRASLCLRMRFTPSAGSHTYKVTAIKGSVNGVVNAGPGGTGNYPPAYLRFTKV